MNNYIIKEPCKDLRASGRGILSGMWWPAIGTFIIAMMCMSLVPELISIIFGTKVQIAIIANIYMLLITGPFAFGMTKYMLDLSYKKEVSSATVFSGFEMFLKTFGLTLYMGILVLLWALLLVVPGIIAVYRYSMAFYVLADNPDMSIKDCINESKRLMDGNKGKLFLLELSFIGWYILVAILLVLLIILISIPTILSDPNFAYYATYTNEIPTSMAIYLLVSVVVSTILATPIAVYLQSTITGFYRVLVDNKASNETCDTQECYCATCIADLEEKVSDDANSEEK